jgi:hypothetical protein
MDDAIAEQPRIRPISAGLCGRDPPPLALRIEPVQHLREKAEPESSGQDRAADTAERLFTHANRAVVGVSPARHRS